MNAKPRAEKCVNCIHFYCCALPPADCKVREVHPQEQPFDREFRYPSQMVFDLQEHRRDNET